MKKFLLVIFFIILLLTMTIAIHFGTYKVPIMDVFNVIAYHLGIGLKPIVKINIIVWEVRIPRVILASIVGMALSTAGTVFQGLFQNPLVEPYILGVSSGAACGAAVSIVLSCSILSVQFTAFIFAMLAMAMAYTLATRKKETPLVNLILSGIIVSSLFTAILNYIKITAGDKQLREITFWLMGGFYTAAWKNVKALFLFILVSIIIIWAFGWKLNVLTMGEQEARSMGVSVGPLKLILISLATFITAISVATVGIISWVGLMVPHMARMTIGPDHRYLIPLSALFGGIFMVICDTLARILIMGEIPISIITSIVGTPYLIYLLRTNRQVYFN
ncbi:FecCD family ABC transporter permease [Clostridium lundense]|uniref:FecCD family ABC transporter permease n=1 Tax=Clostridium lundense TaxID=319475 RepID=UPI0005516F31|nr:iron ABC transporter permease [Clostridium lundense]